MRRASAPLTLARAPANASRIPHRPQPGTTAEVHHAESGRPGVRVSTGVPGSVSGRRATTLGRRRLQRARDEIAHGRLEQRRLGVELVGQRAQPLGGLAVVVAREIAALPGRVAQEVALFHGRSTPDPAYRFGAPWRARRAGSYRRARALFVRRVSPLPAVTEAPLRGASFF